MINLLSDQRKDDIRAARVNVILLRYTAIIVLAIIFIAGSLFVSYSLLALTHSSNQAIIASNDTKASVYSETKNQVDELSAKLADASTALNQEVRYSQALVKLGQITPAGTIIDKLTLTTASFNGTPIELTAYAKSTAEATTLQTQLQSSPLFSQVTLVSTESQGINGYPVTVKLNVTFNKAGI
jgi:Tfp pilus assembly protein PilN